MEVFRWVVVRKFSGSIGWVRLPNIPRFTSYWKLRNSIEKIKNLEIISKGIILPKQDYFDCIATCNPEIISDRSRQRKLRRRRQEMGIECL